MKLIDLEELINPKLLALSMDDQIYKSCTHDDENIAISACKSSARWAFLQFYKRGAQDKTLISDEEEIIRLALVQRAIYELGRQSQFDENFDINKKDAYRILYSFLGLKNDEDAADSNIVSAFISKDKINK